MARIDSSDPLLALPLSVEDVQGVGHDLKSFTRDKGRIEVFVHRAYATARALNELKQNFDVELSRRARSVTTGTPSNMSPEQAARFLSPEQLTKLFDRFMQDKLAVIEHQRMSAENDARQIDAVVAALRAQIGELMADPSVPDEVRARFARTLDAAVEQAAQMPMRTRNSNPTHA